MKGIIYFFAVILLWIMIQIKVDSFNPCSNFAPSNIGGGCGQEIEQ
jgi:hypothetical protein